MLEKRLEEKFKEEMEKYMAEDEHISQGEVEDEEIGSLIEIGKTLWNERACPPMDEEKLRNRFMQQLQEDRESRKMNKNRSLKRVAMVATLAAVLGVGMTQTAFGQGIIDSVMARFSTGNASVVQLNEEKDKAERAARIEKSKSQSMPEEYKGKIFDAQGKEFTYFPMYMEGAYNAKGEPILCAKDGQVYTEAEWNKKCEEEDAEEPYIEITDSNKINDYTCFDVTLPTYLPNGIQFSKAGVWCEEEKKDSPIVEMSFTNASGKEVISMQERKVSKEAGFETDTYDDVKEVDINGVKGLMYDNSLNWETDKAIYMMMSLDDSITREQMIEIAKSIKEK